MEKKHNHIHSERINSSKLLKNLLISFSSHHHLWKFHIKKKKKKHNHIHFFSIKKKQDSERRAKTSERKGRGAFSEPQVAEETKSSSSESRCGYGRHFPATPSHHLRLHRQSPPLFSLPLLRFRLSDRRTSVRGWESGSRDKNSPFQQRQFQINGLWIWRRTTWDRHSPTLVSNSRRSSTTPSALQVCEFLWFYVFSYSSPMDCRNWAKNSIQEWWNWRNWTDHSWRLVWKVDFGINAPWL